MEPYIVIPQRRAKLRYLLLLVLLSAVIIYFSYHAINGRKGLITMMRLSSQLETSKAQLDEVHAERLGIEHKVKMLYSSSTDLDLLDEQARKLLALAGKNEVMTYITPEKPE